MVADPASLRFFVDESLMGLGKTLARARKDVVHTGHPLIPGAFAGALDTEWMPVAAGQSLVVIGRDRHVRTRPAELLMLRQYGLRVFRIVGRKDLSTWGYLTRIVRRWDDIERITAIRGPGPWFMAIHETRVTELTV
jgi:hypothetical protein